MVRLLTPVARRRALRLGLINSVIWALGYSMTSGAIVSYLAIDLGATGRALSFLLAAPSLAGLFRLFSPAMISAAGSTKRVCVGSFGLAYLALMGLPLVGICAPYLSRPMALTMLIGVYCLYQLLDFIGFVAFWSWFAQLVPLRVRGNYFGWRQALQIAVTIPAALGAGYFSDHWRAAYKDSTGMMLLGYAIPTGCGAVCLLCSLIPLFMIPAAGDVPQAAGIRWREMIEPLRQWQFRRLLTFRSWMSVANGISQSAERTFPKTVLKLGLGDMAVMKNFMQVGQLGVARWAGPFSDRYGNRPVLVACQWLVSLAMVFFMIASPATRWQTWLILGAYILWSFYAGHNVCLPNLAIKLAPGEEKSPFVAAHEALASLCHGAATIAGGFLFDWLGDSTAMNHLGINRLNPYLTIFGLAIGARILAVPLAMAIHEPGAWRWRKIMDGKRFASTTRTAAAQNR